MTPFEKLQAQRASWLPQNNLGIIDGIKSLGDEMQMNAGIKDATAGFGQQLQDQMPYRQADAQQLVPLPNEIEKKYQDVQRQQGDISPMPMTTPYPGKAKTKADQDSQKKMTQAQNQYEKNMRKFMEHREKLVKNAEDRARLIRGGENKVDLSALMALADSETGSNLARSYKAPMSPEQREQLALQIEGKAGQGYGALANNEYMMASLQNQRDIADRNAQLREKIAQIKGPGKMGGELIKRLEFTTLAKQKGNQLLDALNRNVTRRKDLPFISDNDFTQSLRGAAELYGRMQSGGAINKDEEKRFISTIFKYGDDKERTRKKIKEFIDDMNTRERLIRSGGRDIPPLRIEKEMGPKQFDLNSFLEG